MSIVPLSQINRRQKRAIGRVIADPDAFCRVFLGDDLWPGQTEILRALMVPRARVAVKACHSSGKTFTAARATTHFVVRHSTAQVVTTAPTWTQVKRLLWKEIQQRASRAFIDLDILTTEMRTPGGSNAFGLSTNEGVRFQGFHGTVLIVIDEAVGVAPDIWEAIEGIRASGDVRILAIANPTVTGGPFYDTFLPGSGWTTITISAFDTPNLAGLQLTDIVTMGDADLDINPRPELVTRRWVREMHDKYGVESPQWQGRVVAEFPENSNVVIYPIALLNAAQHAGPDPDEFDYCVAGVDVAGDGEDETVVSVRIGGRQVEMRGFESSDSRGDVAAVLGRYKDRINTVHVDAIGMGYYFAKHLRDLGFPVNEVNVGEKSRHPDPDQEGPGFVNLKAEVYWAFRESLESRSVHGLTDETTRRQLATLRFGQNSRGQTTIEEKPAYIKRVGKSPDRAEATILSYLPPVKTDTLAGVVLDSFERVSAWTEL